MGEITIRTVILLFAVFFFLAACGADGEMKTVKYNLSCERVSCPNADDVSVFESGSSKSYSCIWTCAKYKGNSRVYVNLTFWSWDGKCWELDSDYTAGGI